MKTPGQVLRELKTQGKRAFIPYITAGDPDAEGTLKIVRALAQAGADVIELGVPFSDPVADGPVNQRAAERALAKGMTLEGVLKIAGRLRQEGMQTPFVLFTYFNPIHSMGIDRFAREAVVSGVGATLMVDLPPEEADELLPVYKAAGLETVFLASPTTREDRLRLINSVSTGFVYYVSRTGVTGEKAALSETLASELEQVRRHVTQPLAVGFGISDVAQARAVAGLADAVVVGSALVRMIEESPSIEAAARAVGDLAKSLRSAI